MITTSGALIAGGIAGASALGGSLLNYFGNKNANSDNLKIAKQNLAFQRDNLEYQKALQQQIFEREDTAYQRAVADAQNVGINPMALAGSGGASAGQAIDTSAPNNSMQFKSNTEGVDFSNAITAGLSAMEGLNQVMTGQQTRDLLQQQIDSAKFDNLYKAMSAGFDYDPDTHSFTYNPDNPIIHPQFEIIKNQAKDTKASAERNERVNVHQKTYGGNDNSNNWSNLATDLASQAERARLGVKSSAKNAWNNYKNSGYAKSIDSAINYIGQATSNGAKKFGKMLSNLFNKESKSNAIKGNMR